MKSKKNQFDEKLIREDFETFKSQNSDLFEASKKLNLAEQQLVLANNNIEEREEIIKSLKAIERNFTKEIQMHKQTITEVTDEKEKLTLEVVSLRSEVKHMTQAYKSTKETLQNYETKCHHFEKELAESHQRIVELENQILDLRMSNTQQMENLALEVDTLRFELKEVTLHCNDVDGELEQQKEALQTANAKIDELTELKKNLESELLDSADEIELFEQEIAAMQQFIRDKSKLFLFSPL
jgi:chromosome segregation ATPase